MSTAATHQQLALTATCNMSDLLCAIRAVTPHVGKEKNGGGVDRIRVVLDTGVMRLALLATCKVTSAVAFVPLLDADETLDADFAPISEAELDFCAPALKVFRAAFEKTAADTARLDLGLSRRTLQVTDVSGLVDGRTVRVHALGEWTGDDAERVCAADAVMSVCGQPLAAAGSVMLPVESLRSWMASARVLGGLPLRVTTQGNALVAAGALADLTGVAVLGTVSVLGAVETSLGEPAYDGPHLAALMDLLLDGEPAGGEAARECEHHLVTEISSWLSSRPDPGEASADDTADGDDHPGGDAA